MYFSESIEETTRKAFTTFAIAYWVLVGKDFKIRVFVKSGVHFWDENLASVVKNGIQALKYTLAGSIELI